MVIATNQIRMAQVVEHPILADFNTQFAAKSDPSRYDAIFSSARETSINAFYLNQLQMDFYIPTSTALLLKNNLHDLPFTTHTTRSLLYSLKEQGKMGDDCFRFLHQKLNAQDFAWVYRYLYILMLYSKVAEAHDTLAVDPAFQFSSLASYSDRLIKHPLAVIAKEESSLQSLSRKQFLKKYLTEIGANPDCPIGAKEQITAILTSFDRSSFMAFLSQMEKTSELEKTCWRELHIDLSSYQGEEFFNQAYLRLKTQHYYKNCLQRVVTLRQSLERTEGHHLLSLSEKCKKAYNGFVHLLADSKNMALYSPTRFAALSGKARVEWQAINNAFSKAKDQYSHSFCACQSQTPPDQNKLSTWPFNPNPLIDLKPMQPVTAEQLRQKGISLAAFQENQKKTVAIIGCSWGGGHKAVCEGLSSHLSSIGYHSATFDLPEMLISEDSIRNCWITRLLGLDWSMGALFNGLLKRGAFALINFLRFAKSKLLSSFGYSDNELKIVLQSLLRLNPNAVITTYSANNESIIQACKILGIPCIHLATDIDTSVETRDKPPEFRHFKMGVPFNASEAIDPTLKVTTPEQRFISGPPIRHAFTLPRTAQDIPRLKAKWGIESNKKVVVISGGKNGAYSPYAEILAKKYAQTDPLQIPIHVVVICGSSNKDFQHHLEQNVAPITKMPMTIASSYSEEQMEELLSMASYGGALIGKAGGSTVFEAFSRGTRLLVDDVRPGLFSQGFHHFWITVIDRILRMLSFEKQMPWEKVNKDFAKKHGLADTFEEEYEFLPKLDKILNNNGYPVQTGIEIKSIEHTIPKVLQEMMHAAEWDLDAYRARASHRNL